MHDGSRAGPWTRMPSKSKTTQHEDLIVVRAQSAFFHTHSN